MKKSIIISTVLLVCAIAIICCNKKKSDKRNETKKNIETKFNIKNQNLNISVFLDVSDRISPKVHHDATMDFYRRDIGYIASIANSFQKHLMQKKVRLLNDRIQIYIDPAPKNNNSNEIIEQLKTQFDRKNTTKDRIVELESKYTDLCTKLYNQTIKDNDYVGSDIWGFFKNKVNDYCISSNHRNILVIITDGFIYHKDNVFTDDNKSTYLTIKRIKQLGLNKSDWEKRFKKLDCGFITKTKKLNNLEVLVLGINSYKINPFGDDVIRAYWTKWFKEMGIKRFQIKSADLPSNMDKLINDFILN